MAWSMTGFGRGNYANELFAIRIELRSVNHRFLEIFLHLPRNLRQLEEKFRRVIGEKLQRGKIDVTVHFEAIGIGAARVRLDHALAAGYHEALLELAARYELPLQLRLEHLLQLPDLFTIEPGEFDANILWEGISQALNEALGELTTMRRAEGDKLVADLLKRIDNISELVVIIEARAPAVPEAYRAQLHKRLTEVLGQPGLDEIRLAQEIAIYADRCNITEELVRLRSHLGELRGTLEGEGALGRKADFILQEINREINTIGAKANDLAIAEAVIEVKTELEKIREQIQNLE